MHRRKRCFRKAPIRRGDASRRNRESSLRIGSGFRRLLSLSCSTSGAEGSPRVEKCCLARWLESAMITIWSGADASTPRVILLVIALILARLDAGDPIAVGFIPINGGLEALFKRNMRFPSGFPHQFFAGPSVAAIMTGAILHGDHQAFRLAEQGEHHLHYFDVGERAAASDVIDLAGASALDRGQNGAAMTVP